MRTFICGIVLAVVAVGSAPAVDGNPVDGQGTQAVAAVVATNAFDALQAQEQALDLQVREITQKLMDLNRPLWTARQKAMTDDPEIRALNAELIAKQGEIEKKLMAKNPELAAKMKERDALVRQHAELTGQLRAIRQKQNVQSAIPTKTEKD